MGRKKSHKPTGLDLPSGKINQATTGARTWESIPAQRTASLSQLCPHQEPVTVNMT